MLDLYANSFLTASRFTSYTRPAPATEQRLEKYSQKPSTGAKSRFRSILWF